MAYKRNIYSEWLTYCCYLHSATARDIAKKIGVTPGTIYTWTQEIGQPRIRLIKKMVEISQGKFKPSDFHRGFTDV